MPFNHRIVILEELEYYIYIYKYTPIYTPIYIQKDIYKNIDTPIYIYTPNAKVLMKSMLESNMKSLFIIRKSEMSSRVDIYKNTFFIIVYQLM